MPVGNAMWHRWSFRAKIIAIIAGVVLPVMVTMTTLTIRLSRKALEDDIRESGVALARELAASAPEVLDESGGRALQAEAAGLVGKAGMVDQVAIYALLPDGLLRLANAGRAGNPGAEETLAARTGREVVAFVTGPEGRAWRIAVPIARGGQIIGVVALRLPLDRAEAVARLAEQQAVGLGAGAIVLLVIGLAAFMSRALSRPVEQLVDVMRQAEEGDLRVRSPEGRQDEVGQLSRGLNRMLERVASFHTELARQVAAATAELRGVNQRLFTMQQEAGRNERLAIAGEMAAAMAHDVGTPLTAVSAHLELLAEEMADAKVRDRLVAIQAQVDRAVTAARGFLEAARPAPTRVPVDVPAVLKELSTLIGPEAERKGVAVAWQAEEGLPRVAADPSQMHELFLNLVANALEAMGNGGRLQLWAERAKELNGGVRVVVEDTGPGMTPETAARAFEPFFTTRGAAGGTGLGLAICRRIVVDHGGTLALESEPGQGTRAVVELPGEAG
ncbi:MAG TPA: ATP-binding protein [Candidatus Sulfotelmatobacter sp.]|nr:ATP-binding protein [Candidatus Sulfotelmatobacter sp.]